jgi:hypothetical protein
MRKLVLLISVIMTCSLLSSQVVYEHISNEAIYDFLDEMANEKFIEINTVVKPYSRKLIAEKLLAIKELADENKIVLNKRQRKELDFYLHGFQLEAKSVMSFSPKTDLFKNKHKLSTAINPLGIYYKDSLFTFSFKLILGLQYWSNDNGTVHHRWNGFESYGYVGDNFGVYCNLRDNYESERLISPDFFNQRPGVPVKGNNKGGVDYSEARGGLIYSWKWGELGLVKDHEVWGNNYNGSNILSGRTPSFAHIKLKIKPVRWFEFNYMHGWLVSEVIDSSRSYWDGNTFREAFHDKYIAANMFSVYPIKYLNISFGNSIIYSDIGVQAAYLIPFLFYKSVDHTLNSTNNYSGQNSQMFFDISTRNIRHLNLFFSCYLDELSIERIGDKASHNFVSYKEGFRLSNWPVKNVAITGEYTYTLPMTYQHFVSTTTFETNLYNLGHYMRDNSRDIYFSLQYKPIRGLHLKLSYNYAEHGNHYTYGEYEPSDEAPVLQDITWKKSVLAIDSRYEIVNNAYLFFNFSLSNIRGFDVDGITAQQYLNMFTPEFFHGETTTISFGANLGF